MRILLSSIAAALAVATGCSTSVDIDEEAAESSGEQPERFTTAPPGTAGRSS